MIPITQSKIAAIGPPPQWASFKGFSLLFDTPGEHWVAHESGRRLLQVNTANSPIEFFNRIVTGFNVLGAAELVRDYHFCALPASSYHVTVWDGVNVKNVADLAEPGQAAFRELLAEMPLSLDSSLLEIIHQSPLMQWENWEIRFQFGQLQKWRDRVISIELEPADEASQQTFSQLLTLREALTDQFAHRYQFETATRAYVPHITLGYFANADSGKNANALFDQNRDTFAERMQSAHISFRGIGLYGITDMASFFR